jgi:asparagine synthase (glutamine-hydrolysing)
MCGILGSIPGAEPNLFLKALTILGHRGPDDWGVYREAGMISLGQRRLAILDLSPGGRQPMASASKRYIIVFNGEIYNFIELRGELSQKGYRFKSESDTEVLLAAFEAWGENCLHKLNGMWAFAVWDTKEKRVFLSRDRFGKKPLFYAIIGDKFVFASEMKAIFPFLPAVRASDDFSWMASHIFNYEATDKCLIHGIKRFPAGHYGWFKDGGLHLTRYWNTLDHLVEVPKDYHEQAEALRELFLDACKLRMRSDVPIGTALSGGLDSSATICAMAHLSTAASETRMARDWQHAFVACFPGTPIDESDYARMVTDHLGIQATFLPIDPLKAIDRLDEYNYLFEELYITSPIPFMLTYAAMREHGVVVTVDGHGADEGFGGYAFDYVAAFNDAKLNLSQVSMILDAYNASLPAGSAQFEAPGKWRFWLEWHARQAARHVLRRGHIDRSKDSDHPRWKNLDHLTRRLYLTTHETILPTLLRNYDRYSMANGVEIRMPFMDHRIMTFAFSLPWTSKIRNSFSKALIREAMGPYLPQEVTWRKTKIGFNSPTVDWIRGPLKPFFLDTINSNSFKTCNLIDPRKTSEQVLSVIKNDQASYQEGEDTWTMIFPYFWEKAVIKREMAGEKDR